MHPQVDSAFVDEVTPSLANMREPAPQKLEIPKMLIIPSIAVEHAEENIIVEPMDGRVGYVMPFGGWRRHSCYVTVSELHLLNVRPDAPHLPAGGLSRIRKPLM